jgi:ankyrin repeat protein
LNKPDIHGRTALHYACRSGRPESVRYLIEGGADVSAKDNGGRTPLHAITEFSQEDLLWKEAAAKSGQIDAWGILLGDSARPYIEPAEEYSLDIHKSARCKESIRLLLASGANPRAVDGVGLSVMELAVETQCDERVQALSDLQQRNKDNTHSNKEVFSIDNAKPTDSIQGEWSYEKALHSQDESLFLGFLRSKGDRLLDISSTAKEKKHEASLIHKLVAWGYLSKLEVLANHLEESNMTRPWNDTATKTPWERNPLLHIAQNSVTPNVELYRLLIERFAVPIETTRPEDGMTVLHVLARGRRWTDLEGLEYLIQAGANMEAVDKSGCTPLPISASQKTEAEGMWSEDTASILLQHGARISVLDQAGLSIISKARPSIMPKLLEHGADIMSGAKPALFAVLDALDPDLLLVIFRLGLILTP